MEFQIRDYIVFNPWLSKFHIFWCLVSFLFTFVLKFIVILKAKAGSMKITVQNKWLFNPSQVLTILKPQCHTKTITDYSTILVMRNIWQELEG